MYCACADILHMRELERDRLQLAIRNLFNCCYYIVMELSEPSEKIKRISLSRRKWQLDRDKENQLDFSDQGIQDGGGHHEAGSTNYGELSEPPQKKSMLSLSRRKQQFEKKTVRFWRSRNSRWWWS